MKLRDKTDSRHHIVKWTRNVAILTAISVVAGACSGAKLFGGGRQQYSPRVVNYGEPVPKGGGAYKIGRPYQVENRWYQPRENVDYDRVGVASWYGDLFHGRRTANGEIFDMDALTAAHPTLPMPVLVQITNLENGRSLVVRVNDRGPYRSDRIIDLSRKSAKLLGFYSKGTARVRVRYMRKAPLNGDDSFEQRFAANMKLKRTRQWFGFGQYARSTVPQTDLTYESSTMAPSSGQWPYGN